MNTSRRSDAFIILILGILTALSPFSIDMYLPAFPKMAQEFNTAVSEVALSLSSFFVGLAVGQLFYGPFLDRFGRKRPLYVGLVIYLLATVGCLLSHNIQTLIVFRFLQAIGGCAAGVAAIAMVRDFFPPKDGAKVFSLLVLILGVSPILAPTVGGYLAAHFGWQAVFVALGIIALGTLLISIFLLPEGHQPDTSQSLKPGIILKDYWKILKNPQFYTYTFSGAIAFSGLFTYLAGSPMIFMEIFKVSEQTYGWIFAVLAIGLIGASQVNIFLLRVFSNEKILTGALIGSTVIGVLFLIGTLNGMLGLAGTIVAIFCFLACVGFSNPNSASLAIAPFAKDAGKASALMGCIQMAIGALASLILSLFKVTSTVPMVVVMAATSAIALGILIVGRKKIGEPVTAPQDMDGIVVH